MIEERGGRRAGNEGQEREKRGDRRKGGEERGRNTIVVRGERRQQRGDRMEERGQPCPWIRRGKMRLLERKVGKGIKCA